MTTPSQNPPDPAGAAQEETYKPRPLQLDLPRALPDEANEPAVSPDISQPPVSRAHTLGFALASLLAVGAAAAAIAVWALPWYVRRQSIEVAAEHGIVLSVDSARIETEGFRLVGVRATWVAIPGARAQAPEVDVKTAGLRPQKMMVHGAEVTLGGRFGSIGSDFASWRESPRGGQAGAWAPALIIIDGSRITWQGSIGETARVDATDAHAEIAWHDRGFDLHARSDQVVVAVPEGNFGPWRVDIDRSPGTSRVRVALDPGVPEACTILVVGDGDRTNSVDVIVPRSPLAHLGLPPHLLGSTGGAVQVETTVHYVALGPTRADATMVGGIYGITAPGLPLPIDVAWEGTASGDPTTGIDVKKARLAVGPLVGPLTGTLKRFDEGFRLDLGWAAGPVPCPAFLKSLGLGSPFDIGYALRSLARSARLADGDVKATASVSFDSRNFSSAKIDFVPEVKCKAGVFQ